jgi:hypothetical protein
MTFLAVGISLMLFGSIQMMSAGMEDTLLSGIEEDQSWDAQVFINPDGEGPVLNWANNVSATSELMIEMPLGSVGDDSGIERVFTLVGLNNYQNGMRQVNLLDGDTPSNDSDALQVMMDEGAMKFLSWDLGDTQTVSVNGVDTDVEIVGITRGEMSRTMYFLRGDLSEITGVNATSIYLDLPEGVEVNAELGEVSVGIVERQDIIDGMTSLLQ